MQARLAPVMRATVATVTRRNLLSHRVDSPSAHPTVSVMACRLTSRSREARLGQARVPGSTRHGRTCPGGMVTRETSNGQTLATMITLTSADQQSRCRMTVRRHRAASLLRRESKSQGRSRGLSVHSALSSFALLRHPEIHAALTTSTWWPTAQTKPASSRATAVSAIGRPRRPARWRYR